VRTPACHLRCTPLRPSCATTCLPACPRLGKRSQVNGARKTLAVTAAAHILPSATCHGWELVEHKAKGQKVCFKRAYCVLWRLPGSRNLDTFYLLVYPDHAAHKPDTFLTLGPGGYQLTTPPQAKENEFRLRIHSHESTEHGARDNQLVLCFGTPADREVWYERLHRYAPHQTACVC
jgi:hypothetical protein